MKRISYLVVKLLLDFFNIFHDFDQPLSFISSHCNQIHPFSPDEGKINHCFFLSVFILPSQTVDKSLTDMWCLLNIPC